MLSAFDREESDASVEKLDKRDPLVNLERTEPVINLERKQPVIDFDGKDSLPLAESLPLRGSSDPSFVRYEPAPADRKNLTWIILGIALLVLASVSLVVWSRGLFETRKDPDAVASSQNSPQTAPLVPQGASEVSPPAPEPQPPPRSDAPAATVATSQDAVTVSPPARAQPPPLSGTPAATSPPSPDTKTIAAAPAETRPTRPELSPAGRCQCNSHRRAVRDHPSRGGPGVPR